MEGKPNIQDIEQVNLKKEIGLFFDTCKNEEERFNGVIARAERFIKAGILDREKLTTALKKYSKTENKEEFVEGVFNMFIPFILAKQQNPKLIEQIRAQEFIEQGNFIKLNEILSYNIDDNDAHIHIAPAKELLKETGQAGFIQLISDGLLKLTEVVKVHNEIKKITASSWFVAKYPRIMEKLGFKIVGPISDEKRNEYFGDDTGDIQEAQMTRDELLDKYGN